MGFSDLPVASAGEHVKAFARLGWTPQPKRGKGSHIILTKPGERATLSLPNHNPVKRGTLAALLRAAGVPVEQYVNAYRNR